MSTSELERSPRTPSRRRFASTAALALALATPVALAAAPARADNHVTVVAQGLDNPRHLSFGTHGDLYVAEAGRGGEGQCLTGPEGDEVCLGDSGAVTRVRHGVQRRVVTGLPSVAAPGGAQAIGPTDVAPASPRAIAVSLGLGADPAVRDAFPASAHTLGTIQVVTAPGTSSQSMRTFADITAHEAATNPIHDPDSNPGGLIKDGSGYVIADAGGNTIVAAAKGGATSTVTVLQDQMATAPPFLGLPEGTQIPAQAVPTSVVRGPDGALYVSQLTGFPFEAGLSTILRIAADGTQSVYASGLTNVTDLAFDGAGTLYAVQLASDGLLNGPVGALVRVTPGSASHTVVAGGLFAPYGVALRGGAAYVTTGSIVAGGGQVVRVSL
ncbi:ScyD/ScyE family protein [Janibacter sp. G1551]|uniref:ScyD/ScyE family protein n=1 Tax=Janibacter sp. G1551 TaxID=3420440 RepID=UPI003D01D97B